MADLLIHNAGRALQHRESASSVAVMLLKVAMLACLFWYAGQVVMRPARPMLLPAPDVHWGLATVIPSDRALTGVM
ncbi:MAG: hypothetical protein DYG96_16445 [Chlorobi bacterium CHB2]|nr:hypothetical protein [Chlorobi bacterium CHB2]